MGQRYNFSISTVIGNVDTPTLALDAANKAYVDSRPTGSGTVTLVSSTFNAFSFGANPTITPALTITNASSPNTQFLRGDGSWQTAVTSVGLTSSATPLTVGGATITGAGAFTLTWGTGQIPVANLGSGTASSANFLRGDGSWATPSTSSGTVTAVTTNISGLTFGTNTTTTPVLAIQNASSPSTQFLRGDGQWQTAVTSVAMSVPTGFAIGGSPITGSGTLALTYSGQIPATSLGTGQAIAANFLDGAGVWTPILTGVTVNSVPPAIVGTLNLINGTNTTVVRNGLNVSINVAGIGTGTVTQVTSGLTAFNFGANQTTTPVLTVVGGSSSTYLRGDGTWQTAVTSVDMTVPTGFAIGGRPIIGSGTLALTYSGQIPVTSLGTGTASSSNFLRGDGTWATPPSSSGTVTAVTTNINGFTFGTNTTTTPVLAIQNASTPTTQYLRGDGTWQPVLISAQVSGQAAITGALTLAAGSNITLTQNANTITIASTATGSTTGVWFSGAGAPTTVAGAALGNYYWDTAALNAYLMTALVGATQTWTAQPNLDSYVRTNADGRIAFRIGSNPVPPGIEFTSTNTTTGTYSPGVFPVDQPFSNLVAALLAIGDGIVQNPTGNWTLPANPILISITQNPTAAQYTRITQITQSALEINLVVDTMNQAYFSGSTYPQTLYIVSQRFTFQSSPQAEILRLASTVVPTTPGQNFAIRDDVNYACIDANNNTFAGIVTSDRATASIVFAQAVADGTTVSNIGITFTSSVPSSFVNGISIVTFATPSLFNITASILSVSGNTYLLAGELNTVNNTSVPAGTYSVIVARAAKSQTLQGLVGNVNLTSQNSSVAINVSGQNIDLAATGSGGGASSTNFEQIFQVLGGAFPTSITTWGGVDNSEPYGYAALPITNYTGGQINNVQYFQPANYVNPYGQPLTFPRAIGGGVAPYSNFTTRMIMPTLNNVSMTLNTTPPATGWSVNVWFTRIQAIGNGDTPFDRANILPFMQAYNTSSDGPNNVPVQAPVLATPTISGNTITWATINPGLWVGSVPEFGFNPSVPGSTQQYVPVFYITHNTFAVSSVTNFTVGSLSGQGYYEMDLSLGAATSPNTNLQQAVNLGNSITNTSPNVGTIQISDTVANPARTTILTGSSVTTPSVVLPGITTGSITLAGPASISTYSLTLPNAQSNNANNVLYVNASGQSSFSLPTLALQTFSNWTNSGFTVATAAAVGASSVVFTGNASTALAAGVTFAFSGMGVGRNVSTGATFDGTNTTVSLLTQVVTAINVGFSAFLPTVNSSGRFNTVGLGANLSGQITNGVLAIASSGGAVETLQQVLNSGSSAATASGIASFTLTDSTTTAVLSASPTLLSVPQLRLTNTGTVGTLSLFSSGTNQYNLIFPNAQSNNNRNFVQVNTFGQMSFTPPVLGNVIFSSWADTSLNNLDQLAIGVETFNVFGNQTTTFFAGDNISWSTVGATRYVIEQVTFNSVPNNTTITLLTPLTAGVNANSRIYKGTIDSSTQTFSAVNVGNGLEYVLTNNVLNLVSTTGGAPITIPGLDQVVQVSGNSTRTISVQPGGFQGVALVAPGTLAANAQIQAIGPNADAGLGIGIKGAGNLRFGSSDITLSTESKSFTTSGVTTSLIAGTGGGSTQSFTFGNSVITAAPNANGVSITLPGQASGIPRIEAVGPAGTADINLVVASKGNGSITLASGSANSSLQLFLTSSTVAFTALSPATDCNISLLAKGIGVVAMGNGFNSFQIASNATSVSFSLNQSASIGHINFVPRNGGDINLGNQNGASGIQIAGGEPNVAELRAFGAGNAIDIVLVPKTTGNFYPIGNDLTNIPANQPKIYLPTAAGTTTLGPGAAGQAIISNATDGAPFWGYNYPSGLQSVYTITSTAVGSRTGEQLGTMTTAAPFSGAFVTQSNNLGLTFNTATGAITGWVGGATYQVVMIVNLISTLAQAFTTYWSAVPGAYPVSIATYGNGMTVGVFRALINRANDGIPQVGFGWWKPAAASTALNLQYFTDQLSANSSLSLNIDLLIARLS